MNKVRFLFWLTEPYTLLHSRLCLQPNYLPCFLLLLLLFSAYSICSNHTDLLAVHWVKQGHFHLRVFALAIPSALNILSSSHHREYSCTSADLNSTVTSSECLLLRTLPDVGPPPLIYSSCFVSSSEHCSLYGILLCILLTHLNENIGLKGMRILFSWSGMYYRVHNTVSINNQLLHNEFRSKLFLSIENSKSVVEKSNTATQKISFKIHRGWIPEIWRWVEAPLHWFPGSQQVYVSFGRIISSEPIFYMCAHILLWMPLEYFLIYFWGSKWVNSEMLVFADFIFLGSKITADNDCSHEIKRHLIFGRRNTCSNIKKKKKNTKKTHLFQN